MPWLKTVVKHEAFALRRQRERHTPARRRSPTTRHRAGVATPRPGRALRAPAHGRRGAAAAEAAGGARLRAEGARGTRTARSRGRPGGRTQRSTAASPRAGARFLDARGRHRGGRRVRAARAAAVALADGEATPPTWPSAPPPAHVPGVPRAAARLPRGPARVAAMAPPVAVGYSLLDSARYVLDAASGWLSERSAGLAARWHQAAELTMAHKGAAVVASATVLGGGGAATVATVTGGPAPARPAASAAAPATTSPQPPFATSGIAAPAAPSERDDRERRGGDSTRPAERPDQAKRAPEPSPRPGEFTSASPPPAAVARQPEAAASHTTGTVRCFSRRRVRAVTRATSPESPSRSP